MKKIILILCVAFALSWAKGDYTILARDDGWLISKYFNNVSGLKFTSLKFTEVFSTWDEKGKVKGKFALTIGYSKYTKTYDISIYLLHNDGWLWGKEGSLYILINSKKRLTLKCHYDSKKIKGFIYTSYCSYALSKKNLLEIANSYKAEFEFSGKYFAVEGEFSLKMKKGIKEYIKLMEKK